MATLSGYARVMAQVRAKQAQQKPFFGKPYLKLGQCLALWGYFFQMGGVLGAKHTASPDEFGPAFLGAQGEAGAVRRFFTMVAEEMVDQTIDGSTIITDYVLSESMKRLGYTGDASDFFLKFGMQKINPDTAAEVAWQFAEQGAAFGAVFPKKMRAMIERSNSGVSDESWERDRAAGLDIPPEQDRISYEEIEEGEDGLFMAYCQECCPAYYSVFTS